MVKWRFMSSKGELPYAYVHGYNFGDKLLEDVFFKITINGTKFKAEVSRPDDYTSGLNMGKWEKEAEKYSGSEDTFQETEKGGEDVWVEDVEGNINPHIKYKTKPIIIKGINGMDLLKNLAERR